MAAVAANDALDRSGSRWFARPADPRAPLSEYLRSKVSVGMAVPPQSDYVRKQMLEYWASLGIAPPAAPRTPPAPARPPRTTSAVGAPATTSGPVSLGGAGVGSQVRLPPVCAAAGGSSVPAGLRSESASSSRAPNSRVGSSARSSMPKVYSAPSLQAGRACRGAAGGACGSRATIWRRRDAQARPAPQQSGYSREPLPAVEGHWTVVMSGWQPATGGHVDPSDGESPMARKRSLTDTEMEMLQSRLRWRARRGEQLPTAIPATVLCGDRAALGMDMAKAGSGDTGAVAAASANAPPKSRKKQKSAADELRLLRRNFECVVEAEDEAGAAAEAAVEAISPIAQELKMVFRRSGASSEDCGGVAVPAA